MVITTNDIQLFQILKQKLGEKEAEALVSFVESKIKSEFEQNQKILATKEDINNVRLELRENKSEILKWMIVLFAPFYIGMIVFLIKQFL